MTSTRCPRPDAGPDRFCCSAVAADAATAARIRGEFDRWLRRRTGLDENRLCDVVLAVNEALANVAEFAYRTGVTGAVDLEAVFDRGTLTVTIADRGRWRDPDPVDRQRRRGRGIPLMRTLADAVVIDTSDLGSSVCLRFDDVDDAHRSAAGGLVTR